MDKLDTLEQDLMREIAAAGDLQALEAARVALHLVGALAHAVALVGLVHPHLAGAGEAEALLGAAPRLELGHFAVLSSERPVSLSPKGAWDRAFLSGWACPLSRTARF